MLARFPWILGGVLLAAGSCGDGDVGGTTPVVPAAGTSTSPPASEALRIMPLGDSITQGDSRHDSYRRPLFKSLQSLGRSVDFVGSQRANHGGGPPHPDFDLDHEGHWGWRVDEVLESVRGWVEAAQPDVLLVHLGSNDVFHDESVESTHEELKRLIGVVREVRPRATFLVAQIISTTSPTRNQTIRELNARIATLGQAAGDGSRVIVVDMFTGFDPESMTYDGVHPNPAGEIHVSDRFLNALDDETR